MEPIGHWTRAGLFGAVLLAACHSRPPEQMASVAAAACLPPSAAALDPTTRVGAWVGDYQLTLVATTGAKMDQHAVGTLTLTAMPESFQHPPAARADSLTTLPLIGTTGVDLGAIGAVKVGSLESGDPERPGVLVLERRGMDGGTGSLDVTIRLGSDANDWSKVRFDGGYTALFVRQADTEGFAGVWQSGVTALLSSGHFCARRVGG